MHPRHHKKKKREPNHVCMYLGRRAQPMGASAITFGPCPPFVLVGVSRGMGPSPSLPSSSPPLDATCTVYVLNPDLRVESLGLLRPSSLGPPVYNTLLAGPVLSGHAGSCRLLLVFFVVFGLVLEYKAPPSLFLEGKGDACGRNGQTCDEGLVQWGPITAHPSP